MKYQIVSNGKKISPAVQERVVSKLSRLEKLLFKSEELECRIVVKFRGERAKIEITIPTPFLILRSEAEANDLLDATDVAKEKLEKQIAKVKTRMDRSANRVNLGKTFGLPVEEENKEAVIVRNKTVHPLPMTLDDAIMQMDSMDHDFYIYEDIEDHTISVVYVRKDGGYGVIDIE